MPRVKGDYTGPDRLCTGECNQSKKWDEFGMSRTGTNGRKSVCKMCESLRRKLPEARTAQRAYRIAERLENPCKRLLKASKSRSRDHNISLSDVEEAYKRCNGKCPVIGCGRSFRLDCTPGDRYSAPSLDRIDSSLGYVSGNIWVICFECNHLKRDHSAARLSGLAESIRLATLQNF